MSELHAKWAKAREERLSDSKARHEARDPELCQLCHAHGQDKRTLMIRYFYEFQEIVPEMIDLQAIEGTPEELQDFYYITTCKVCRGALLEKMAEWRAERIAMRDTPKDHDGYPILDEEDGIWVRVYGTEVLMTPEEYADHISKLEESEE